MKDLIAKFRALPPKARAAGVVALLFGVGSLAALAWVFNVAIGMSGIVSDTNKIHTAQHIKFGANVDHSTTTIHGGHSLVVDGDSLGGFESGADKTFSDALTHSSTDNFVCRFDGTTGGTQNSLVSISDTGLLASGADAVSTNDVPRFHQIQDAITTGKQVAVDALLTTNQATTTGLAQTVDGVALSGATMRVCLFGQTTSTADGCYNPASGAWTRTTDVAVGADLAQRVFTVRSGTANKGTWVLTNAIGAGIVGTNDLVGLNVSGSGGSVTESSVRAALAALTAPAIFNGQELQSIGTPTAVTSAEDVLTGNNRVIRATVASASALPAYTASGGDTILTANSNGAAPAIDGIALIANTVGFDTILLRHGAADADNGLWKLTQQGDAGTPWILTRSVAADTSAKLQGAKVRIRFGTHFRGSEWELPTSTTITIGATGIYFQPTNDIPYPYVGIKWLDDFEGIATSTTVGAYLPGGWLFAPTGTAANITVATSTHDGIGFAALGTGTTTTGAAVIGKALGNGTILFATGDDLYVLVRFNYTTLSDGTNTYKGQIGLGNVSGVAQTNGLYFEYDQVTQTTHRCVAMKASSPTVATGPTVTAAQNYAGEIIKTAGDTTVHMYIDGTECGTGFTSGLVPSATAISPYAAIVKSAGATARQLNVDAVSIRDVVNGTRF